MKQVITQSQFSKSPDESIDSVRQRGDFVVISREGADDVAIMPLHVLDGYERSRRRAAEIMSEVATSAAMPEQDAMRLALEEIAASRWARSPRFPSQEATNTNPTN